MSKPKIIIEDLTVTFPGLERPAVDHVSFNIENGEFVLIAGPSGGGKSTLARSIKGVIPHMMDCVANGRVIIDEVEVANATLPDLATRVGMVFQDPETQLCNLFIGDEICFGPENLCYQPSEINKRFEEAVKGVQLDPNLLKGRFVYEISGGEKQRVAIAGVLAMASDVIIFDEPSANLDPIGAQQTFDAIRNLHASGHTVIVVEHKLDPFIDIADRLIIIKNGRLEYDEHPRRLIAEKGSILKEECGLWIPDVAWIAIKLRDSFPWDRIPLTPDELYKLTYKRFKEIEYRIPVYEERKLDKGNTTVVSFNDLKFSYPDGNEALRGISAEITEGEVIAIVGKNGSGKSTLARLLVGLLIPERGESFVCGINPAKSSNLDISTRIGYVFQYPEHQFIKENVYDEVAYGLEVHGYSTEEIEVRVEEILNRFHLVNYKVRHPISLSGGEKRRLSVATMLVLDPRVLILDEPTFGQDQENSHAMMSHLLSKMVADRNMTTIVITHDMDLVAEYCDRVLVLEDGHMIFDGQPYELFNAGDELLNRGSIVRSGTSEYVHRLIDSGIKINPELVTADQFIRWFINFINI